MEVRSADLLGQQSATAADRGRASSAASIARPEAAPAPASTIGNGRFGLLDQQPAAVPERGQASPMALIARPEVALALASTIGNKGFGLLVQRQSRGRRPGRNIWSVNPINQPHPARAPMATELMADPVVREAMRQAWHETNANEPGRPHAREQGGWIYISLTTGAITVRRAQPPSFNDRAGTYHINLGNPPLVPGFVLVGVFHTHPSGSTRNEIDEQAATFDSVPNFVVHGDLLIDSYGLPVRGGSWLRAAQEPLRPR